MQRDYCLRKRYISGTVPETSKEIASPTTLALQEIKEMANQSEHQSSKELPEIPIIKMKDFSVVDMNEKLNLIMVAINKMNTNFHHKFEDFNRQLNDGDSSIIKRLEICEETLQNHHDVYNDEQQGILPHLRDVESTISDLALRLETLEEQKAQITDELFALKGVMQVQDNKIMQMDKKIVDLTARNMKIMY